MTTTRRPPLKMPQRFEVMRLVREQLPTAEMTDAEFARHCTEKIGAPVSAGTVTNYREQFGIPRYAPPSVAELRMRIRHLQGELDLARDQAERQ